MRIKPSVCVYVYSYENLGGGLGYTIRNTFGHLHSSYVQEADAKAFCALLNAWPGLRDLTEQLPRPEKQEDNK